MTGDYHSETEMFHTKLFSAGLEQIDFSSTTLWLSLFMMCFNPLFWNTAARLEYKHKAITRMFGGRAKVACYSLGATIFILGLIRDFVYIPWLLDLSLLMI